VNWAFVRREWGAVTFILTVLVGIVVVPLALYLANQGPGPLTVPHSTTASQAASSARTSPSPSPSHSPSPSPSK
jgi:cytoskeletal protein RodZ